jgi:hypothetical protein
MWSSSRSNGPGVVCHRIRLDSEGKVATVGEVETGMDFTVRKQDVWNLVVVGRHTLALACALPYSKLRRP